MHDYAVMILVLEVAKEDDKAGFQQSCLTFYMLKYKQHYNTHHI